MPQLIFNEEFRAIGMLVDEHLRRSAMLDASAASHLDEDSLSAFVEGRLSERESLPIVKHLVGCGPCRRFTAQLVKLDLALAGDAPETAVAITPMETAQTKPARLVKALQRMASRVVNALTDEPAVFAYEEQADELKRKEATGTKPDTEPPVVDEKQAK